MAVGDIYKVAVVGKQFDTNEPTINTFHYRVTVGVGLDTDLMTAFQSKFQASLLAATTTSWTLVKYQARLLTGGVFPTSELLANVQGTASGPTLPSQDAAVVSKRTALGGRANRGRIYVPGVPASFVSGDDLTPTAISIYQTLGSHLPEVVIDAAAAQYVPVIFHRRLNTSTVITTFKVNPIIRTVRRRQEGVRIHRHRRP